VAAVAAVGHDADVGARAAAAPAGERVARVRVGCLRPQRRGLAHAGEHQPRLSPAARRRQDSVVDAGAVGRGVFVAGQRGERARGRERERAVRFGGGARVGLGVRPRLEAGGGSEARRRGGRAVLGFAAEALFGGVRDHVYNIREGAAKTKKTNRREKARR
jgi:hypothetical protein